MTKTKGLLLTAGIVLAMAFTFSCSGDGRGSFTDSRDGKAYKTVKIGEQVWMAENLSFKAPGSKCFGEGGKVNFTYPEAEDPPISIKTLSAAEVQAHCATHGRLYNWATAKTACPSGWHLPSNADWDKAFRYVTAQSGGEGSDAFGSNAFKLWDDDKYGFSTMGEQGGGNSDGSFHSEGGGWWSATDGVEDKSKAACLDRGVHDGPNFNQYGWGKSDLLSVRCVRDN